MPAVIALHCSGSSGRQWSKLAPLLADRFTLIAPDFIGCGATPSWSGEHRFRLADEAVRIIEIVDAQEGPVHLAGHSYGAGVALWVALERQKRVASLSLYEPTIFHVLPSLGVDGRSALDEVHMVATAIARDIVAGDHRAAALRFVDYWNGQGTWAALRSEAQADLIRYMPKATLEFCALMEEPAPISAYRHIRCPVLVMRGARTPVPTALIAKRLSATIGGAVMEEIAEAGHMGPFSHAEHVSELIAAHVFRATAFGHPALSAASACMATVA